MKECVQFGKTFDCPRLYLFLQMQLFTAKHPTISRTFDASWREKTVNENFNIERENIHGRGPCIFKKKSVVFKLPALFEDNGVSIIV